MIHTILGAGGAIGTPLARELAEMKLDVRLASRSPVQVNEHDALVKANLLNPEETESAIAGSNVCYVCVGLPYKAKVWEESWPILMRNVLNACQKHRCKLVFFDNVYGLGSKQVGHITEDATLMPDSRKGKVRALIDQMVMGAVEKGTVEAMIVRAPDFYGPIKHSSMHMNMLYDNLVKGKAGQWLCRGDMPHSSAYAPELAMGTALLGNKPEAFNQIWNLPCSKEAPTGRQWNALFAHALHQKDALQVLPAWGLRVLGLFIPIMNELFDMRYQYNRPYFFDSSKFEKAFGYLPKSCSQAVSETVDALKT